MIKELIVALIALCAILACGCLETSQYKKSVIIGGHTFTAVLDDNWINTSGEVAEYSPSNLEDQYGIPLFAHDWTGFEDYTAFYYKSGQPSGSITKAGWANIFVLKPKGDLVDSSSKDILRQAAYMIINPKNHKNAVLGNDLTEKEIIYNGKEAYFIEVEGELMENDETGDTFINDNSYAVIAFFLDEDTVALIDAETTNNFGMSARDVINSITVT